MQTTTYLLTTELDLNIPLHSCPRSNSYLLIIELDLNIALHACLSSNSFKVQNNNGKLTWLKLLKKLK